MSHSAMTMTRTYLTATTPTRTKTLALMQRTKTLAVLVVAIILVTCSPWTYVLLPPLRPTTLSSLTFHLLAPLRKRSVTRLWPPCKTLTTPTHRPVAWLLSLRWVRGMFVSLDWLACDLLTFNTFCSELMIWYTLDQGSVTCGSWTRCRSLDDCMMHMARRLNLS